MPITNGKYVNPGWKNGGHPALNADELNAISNTLVSAESKNTAQDSSISSMQSAISSLQSGGAKIATGAYTGTGTYGASNPNSITFPFRPKLVWLYSYGSADTWGTLDIDRINNASRTTLFVTTYMPTSFQQKYGFCFPQSGGIAYSYGKMIGNTFSWYNTYSATSQCNMANYTYYWIAFG